MDAELQTSKADGTAYSLVLLYTPSSTVLSRYLALVLSLSLELEVIELAVEERVLDRLVHAEADARGGHNGHNPTGRAAPEHRGAFVAHRLDEAVAQSQVLFVLALRHEPHGDDVQRVGQEGRHASRHGAHRQRLGRVELPVHKRKEKAEKNVSTLRHAE
ncbi:hypothetical protein ON010_g8944 [Phytophthora cinnamomi]|nr:hypothetical protein ON010_g8944 [Phytophthora cinnamomi]